MSYRDEDEMDIDDLIPPVALDESVRNIVVVDNIPVIPKSKQGKLEGVLKKIFSQVGPVAHLHLPFGDDGKSKSYCFIEFKSAHVATKAIEQTNGYKLDKSHVFRVNSFADFEKYQKMSTEYEPKELPEYKPAKDVYSYLQDPMCRDQFGIRYGDDTEIWRATPFKGHPPELEQRKTKWSETYFTWSPRGSYLATLHPLGVALWGGPKWEKLQMMRHPGVKLIAFSPCEKYLVSFSSNFSKEDASNPKDPKSIIIFDVRSGSKMRGFTHDEDIWPAFQWSYDDKYFARMKKGMVSVYETPSMRLVGGKSIAFDAPVQSFTFCTSKPLISCFVPEMGSAAARVILVSLPTKAVVCRKNLVQVQTCRMHWNKGGDYLCCKVDRSKKKGGRVFTTFEIFRANDRGIPTETKEFEQTCHVIAFAFEPKGHRFAIIHQKEGQTRPSVTFYTMLVKEKHGKIRKRLTEIITLENRSVNHLFWSPQGSNIVMAGFGKFNGNLEFYNLDMQELMSQEEHYMATDIVWDPSGRIVMSYVSYWQRTSENGYYCWTFRGQLVEKKMLEKLYQLSWRPRPPTLLGPKELQKIEKDFSKISDRLAEEDTDRSGAVAARTNLKNAEEKKEFLKFMAQKEAEYRAQAERRKRLRGCDSDDESDWVEVEQTKEVVVTEEVVMV